MTTIKTAAQIADWCDNHELALVYEAKEPNGCPWTVMPYEWCDDDAAAISVGRTAQSAIRKAERKLRKRR